MAFPSPSLPAPILAPWQLQYQGLVFGGVQAGSAYQLQTLDGIGIPDYVSGDQKRAIEQGEFAGIDLAPGRDITIKQALAAPTPAGLDQARQQLAAAFNVGVEQPLWLALPSGVYACLARARKHSFTVDLNTLQVNAAIATTLFHATDPRWYAAPSKTQTVSLPAAPGGPSFPVSFPLDFPTGGYDATFTLTNDGLFETRPIFVVNGPALNPLITNLSLPGQPSLGFQIDLQAGDTLTIDTDWQTVVYAPANGLAVSVQRTQLDQNTWFNLPPGTSTLQFVTFDAHQQATLEVQSADAFLGL